MYCLIDTSFGSESHHRTFKPAFLIKNLLKVFSSQTFTVFIQTLFFLTLSLKLFRDALKDIGDDDASLVPTGRQNGLGVIQSSFARVVKKINYHAYKPQRKHELTAVKITGQS